MRRRRRRPFRRAAVLLIIAAALGGGVWWLRSSPSDARIDVESRTIDGSGVQGAAASTTSGVSGARTPADETAGFLDDRTVVLVTPGGGERVTPRLPTAPRTPGARLSPAAVTPGAVSPGASLPPGLMADARRLTESGDLLAARSAYNRALLSGSLPPEHASAVKGELARLNRRVLFSPRPYADDPHQTTVRVAPGDVMQRIARRFDVPWELVSRTNDNLDPRRLREGQTLKVLRGPFHAEVSKSGFTIDLYLGGLPPEPGTSGSYGNASANPNVLYVMTFPVGLGAEDSTPLGVWRVPDGGKLKDPVYYSPRGEGVIAAGDPTNPLGHRWVALEGVDGDAVGKRSYGLHGTIEPDSIGRMASLGCIRLLNEDVEFVYDVLTDGKSTVRVVP